MLPVCHMVYHLERSDYRCMLQDTGHQPLAGTLERSGAAREFCYTFHSLPKAFEVLYSFFLSNCKKSKGALKNPQIPKKTLIPGKILQELLDTVYPS